MQDIQSFAETLCDEIRPIAVSYFRTSFENNQKHDDSPVTIADKKIEAHLRARIHEKFPHHGVIGEEYGAFQETAEWLWVIDPIDGTKAFMVGKHTFGTLISIYYQNQPVIGIIDQPILQDRWVGVKDKPTTYNNKSCATRKCNQLKEAILNATAPDLFSAEEWRYFNKITPHVRFTHWGGDCYAFGLLASGYIDIIIEAGLKFHDYAALIPIIEGAGGAICDWQGNPLQAESDGTILVVGDKVLKQPCLELLQR